MVRAVGKSKAMEMVLTGSELDAHQAERDGKERSSIVINVILPRGGQRLVRAWGAAIGQGVGDRLLCWSSPTNRWAI